MQDLGRPKRQDWRSSCLNLSFVQCHITTSAGLTVLDFAVAGLPIAKRYVVLFPMYEEFSWHIFVRLRHILIT